MRLQAFGRGGLCAVTWWVLGACGGGDGAGKGDDQLKHADAGDAGTTPVAHDTDGGTGAVTGNGDAGPGDGGTVAADGGDAGEGDGGGQQSCEAGFKSSSSGCLDIDECAHASDNDCGDARCVNTKGGYDCACAGGATFEAGACTCDLTGTFAVRSTAQLSWEDALFGADVVITGGTAQTVGYGLWTVTRDGTGVHAEARSCGTETPDLCSPFFSEAYGQSFPDAIWDGNTVPTQTVTLDFDQEGPGGTFVTAASAAFLGLRFASGVDPMGAFPASALDPSLVWMDDDGDGELGVSSLITAPGAMSTRCSLNYAYLPVDPTYRAKSIHLGARTISHLTGGIDDCDTLSGELFTDSVNGRVHGCTRTDDLPCDPTQSNFLDTQAKGQTIDSTAFKVVRLSKASPTCADVRAATFPN